MFGNQLRLVRLLLLFLCYAMVGPAPAGDQPVAVTALPTAAASFEGYGERFDAEAFAWAETAVALFSWMAAEAPNGYGTLLLAVTPWALAEAKAEFPGDDNRLGSVVAVGVIAVIAGYNISVDEDDYSKDEVFRNNFLFYNLLLGGGYLLSKLSGDENNYYERSRSGISLGLRPTEDGVMLGLNYRF